MNNTTSFIQLILNKIYLKNPLLKINDTIYRDKITFQYEFYLMTCLMNELSEEKKLDFQRLLIKNPLDKSKHNEYLKNNIAEFGKNIIDYSKIFLNSYMHNLD